MMFSLQYDTSLKRKNVFVHSHMSLKRKYDFVAVKYVLITENFTLS